MPSPLPLRVGGAQCRVTRPPASTPPCAPLLRSVIGMAVECVGIADMFGNFLCVASAPSLRLRASARARTRCASLCLPGRRPLAPRRRPNIVDTLKLLPVVGPLARSAPVTWLVDRVRGSTKRRPPV